MKTILSSRKYHYVARVSIFLITLALVVEMVGCSCGGGGLVEYDLTITSTAGGSVTTPGEETFTYKEGKVVDLVAEAEEGYQFVNWTGDVDDIANVEDATTTITMNDDYSITANFVAIYNLSMAANPVGGGTATDETNGSPYAEGTIVSIKAEVNLGYRFVSWTAPVGTCGNATAAETTFTMPAQDVTITANFEPTYQLLIYEDDFSNPNSGWIKESFENYEYSYEDGEYHILVKNFDWSVWAWIGAGPFTDFALEIDARLVSGPSGSAYGVIFRLQNADNFYSFQVKGNGYYYLDKYLNGEWVTLQALTRSDFINEGNSTNHLKVVCEDSQIEIYVNGYHVATIIDDSFPDGYVGIIAYAFGPDTLVAFDNIKVYSLD